MISGTGRAIPMMSRGEVEDKGSGRAPGVAPGADHSRVKGPDGDGMYMSVTLAVALVGRICASSINISRSILGGDPLSSRYLFAEPVMASSRALCTAVRRLDRRRRDAKISESAPPRGHHQLPGWIARMGHGFFFRSFDPMVAEGKTWRRLSSLLKSNGVRGR